MLLSDRERWNARFLAGSQAGAKASPFLVEISDLLPSGGRALDVASGLGGTSIWLAARGFEVWMADLSDVALEEASRRAEAAGVRVNALQIDLMEAPSFSGSYDLIVCSYFLSRELYRSFHRYLEKDGILVVVHPTRTNLDRNPKPGSRHLLEDGELPGLVAPLSPILYQEGWFSGLHEARLAAR